MDWVEHGLGLPQYAPAFKRNAVTALDFPLLLGDGGATLASDLGVSSRLHQQQVRCDRGACPVASPQYAACGRVRCDVCDQAPGGRRTLVLSHLQLHVPCVLAAWLLVLCSCAVELSVPPQLDPSACCRSCEA